MKNKNGKIVYYSEDEIIEINTFLARMFDKFDTELEGFD